MALINYELPTRAYELIRDRIALIIEDELVQQAAVTYEDLFLLPVYVQRSKPFDPSEVRMINVSVESGRFDNQTVIDSDGEYTFFVDVFGIGSYNGVDDGDKLASFEVQRLAGTIQAILSSPLYVTLGFDRPFIMRAKVTGFEPGTIDRGESANISVCRVTFVVKSSQNEISQPAINSFVTSTQVLLYETELGYLYSGVGAPLPPPDPSCEPVNIYDADGNLLGTTASGGTFIVSNAIARLINTLSEEISQTEILAEATSDITAPNATYRVLNSSGGVLASGSIPSNKAQDITVSLATYTYSITDSAGTVLYSGNVTENLVKAIQDAVIQNSDGSYTASILAEGSSILPDITVEVQNSQGTVVNTQTYPSVQDVSTSAPDGTINIKKTGDGTISSQSVPSGATVNYNVADNAITVNGGNDFTIDATDPLDIVLKDSNGSTLTPNSVTHSQAQHKVDIVLAAATTPSPRSTASLLKTGQTVSYRTGDDGDLEAGRATNFLTLDSAPLHNNGSATLNTTTNRFTDELGGQTYTNNIVIDWSTFNGTTVLGWRRTRNGSYVAWNTAIDGALAVSIGSFISGWRLPNRMEILSILNYGITTSTLLNYAPFNIAVDTNIWTSTTNPLVTANAYGLFSTGNGATSAVAKINVSAEWMPCRTFTVTGTTLT